MRWYHDGMWFDSVKDIADFVWLSMSEVPNGPWQDLWRRAFYDYLDNEMPASRAMLSVVRHGSARTLVHAWIECIAGDWRAMRDIGFLEADMPLMHWQNLRDRMHDLQRLMDEDPSEERDREIRSVMTDMEMCLNDMEVR